MTRASRLYPRRWSWVVLAPALVLALVAPVSSAEAKRAAAAGDGGGAEPSQAAGDSAAKTSGEKNQFWVVEFEPKHLRMISPREGPGAGRVYWYLVYTIENRDEEDHDIFLTITATSDGKKEYADTFLPAVEKAIEKREREPLWGKTEELEANAKKKPDDPKYNYVTLKAKEKRKCVAVFNAIDPNVSKVTVRVEGLSNEIRRITAPDGSVELEERVRELRYERPGDEYAVATDSFKLLGTEWVKKRVPLAVTKAPRAE